MLHALHRLHRRASGRRTRGRDYLLHPRGVFLIDRINHDMRCVVPVLDRDEASSLITRQSRAARHVHRVGRRSSVSSSCNPRGCGLRLTSISENHYVRWMRVLVLCAILSACSGPSPCLQDDVSIKQGLFGFISYRCEVDIGGHCGEPIVGTNVELYAPAPAGEQSPVGSPQLMTQTNGNGVYQFSTDVGDYDLCWRERLCARVTVIATTASRFDVIEETRWSTVTCE